MRVPLSTFAQNVKVSGGAQQCQLAVSYLGATNGAQSSNILMGGMFFENFFAVFTNDRSQDPVTQTAQIYTGLHTVGNVYIGGETLPTG